MFQNTLVSKDDNGDLMKTNAEEEGTKIATLETADFKIQLEKQNTDQTSAFILPLTGARLKKIAMLP